MHYSNVVVSQLAQVRRGETVCVVADQGVSAELVSSIYSASNKAGAETHVLRLRIQDLDSERLPLVLSQYCVVFALTSNRGLGLDATHQILGRGTRMIKFPYASLRVANECIPVNYHELRDQAEKIITAVTAAREIHVFSNNRSDLTLSLLGRPAIYVDRVIRKGESMALPRGSVNSAPVEDFGEGFLMVDGTTKTFGKVRDPFKLIVKKGRVTEVVGKGREASWLRQMLKPPFQDVNRLGEFVIGLNPNAKHSRFMPEGEKVRGSIAIDLGYRSGIAESEIGKHIEVGSAKKITIQVDGRTIIAEGKLML
jgi:leucyl aminopeptidase (aminopeptidase T)